MATNSNLPKPLTLIVLDGWGVGPENKGNAIHLAKTPFYDSLLGLYPYTTLESSGTAVGLPKGEMGNSETGHMNLGAGQIVLQDVERINQEIKTGEFFQNKILLEIKKHLEQNKSSLHVMGLLSDAAVHSYYNHLLAVLKFARENLNSKVFLHIFTDGRDSSPDSGLGFLKNLTKFMQENQVGQIASIVGRYYAMDRERRWHRTKVAYDLITQGRGRIETDPLTAIQNAYDRGETDEFIKPILIVHDSTSLPTIKDNDAVIFFNFRTDRPRQLTKAFVEKNFAHFVRQKQPNNLYFATLTRYEKDLPVSGVCYDPPDVNTPLASVIAEQNLRQLHLAERTKFPHVTYFFNGGREEPFKNEDRIEIPSLKIPTFDLRPEMSAAEITHVLIERIRQGIYDFILVNYANPDMVAHTGKLKATIKAIEVIDQQLAKIIPAILEAGGAAIITSDHGNAEQVIDVQKDRIDTEHNTFPSPFVYIAKDQSHRELAPGILADVAPTILEILGLAKPEEMTGRNLLK